MHDFLSQLRSKLPLSLYDVMALSNAHYYANHRVFGPKGDFVTSPDISQIFGEVIGVWAMHQANLANCPSPFIIECGPGRGTLMWDMVRTFMHQKDFDPRMVCIETSLALQNMQKRTLAKAPYNVTWDTALNVKNTPAWTCFIANEFFDALPIRQYRYTGSWQEVYIEENSQNTLAFTQRPVCASSAHFPSHPKYGQIWEDRPDAVHLVQDLAAHLRNTGGCALIIDYGDITPKGQHRTGDTFQAVKNHTFVPPLEHLGTCDLTAHVDFTQLERIFKEYGLRTCTTTQRDFLHGYGGEVRLAKLLKGSLTSSQKEALCQGFARITDPQGMGTLFKVLMVEGPPVIPCT